MKRLARRVLIPAALLGGCLVGPGAAAEPLVDISAELDRLMVEHGFEVRGIEQTEQMQGRAEGDELLPRLRLLLDGFDHVIVQNQTGGIDRVIILGEKVAVVSPPPVSDSGSSGPGGASAGEAPATGAEPKPGEPIVLPTRRQGASHAVTVGLEGAGGQRVEQNMLVDTGADRVVLPASLVAPLGIPPAELRLQQIQTANGMVDGRIGVLSAIWLGEQRVGGVSVAFIEDSKLGGNALLGMSLLARYRITIDDEHNQLTLTKR